MIHFLVEPALLLLTSKRWRVWNKVGYILPTGYGTSTNRLPCNLFQTNHGIVIRFHCTMTKSIEVRMNNINVMHRTKIIACAILTSLKLQSLIQIKRITSFYIGALQSINGAVKHENSITRNDLCMISI